MKIRKYTEEEEREEYIVTGMTHEKYEKAYF